MFLRVPAYPGSPGQKAVKRLCVCIHIHTVYTQMNTTFRPIRVMALLEIVR